MQARAAQFLALEHAVTHVLAEVPSLRDAGRAILRRIGETLGYPLAALFAVNGTAGHLVRICTWHSPELGGVDYEPTLDAPGCSLRDRVLSSGAAVWVADIRADTGCSPLATSGLRTGIGFPIMLGQRVVGVIELYSHETRRPDEPTERVLASLASQLAQFMERRRAEDQTRLSEARKAAVLAAAPDAIITCDCDGRILEFNPAAERIFGHKQEAVLGASLTELLFPPGVSEHYAERMKLRLAGDDRGAPGAREETWARRADGSLFPCEVALALAAGPPAPLFTIFLHDITTRRQAIDALRDSEERHRLIAELTADFTFTGRIVPGNAFLVEAITEGFTSLTGYTLGALAARGGWQTIVHPDDAPIVARTLERLGQGKADRGELRLRTRREELRWVHYLCHPLGSPGPDEAVRVVGVAQDITERKRTERRLREETRASELLHEITSELAAERDVHQILQGVVDRSVELTRAELAVFCCNLEDEAGGESRSLYAVAGVYREAGAQLTLPTELAKLETAFPDRRAVRLDDISAGANGHVIALPRPGPMAVHSYLAVPVVARTGRLLGGLFFGHALPGVFTAREERLVVGMAGAAAVAIESARLYEQQQHRVAELAEEGRRKNEFLALLGHELRNPLAPLRTSLELLRLRGDDNTVVDKVRGIMERQVHQLTRLVDDLLDVSRVSRGLLQLRKEHTDLVAIVSRAAETMRSVLEERKHTLALRLGHGPIWIEADPVRMEQVFWNLLTNAARYTEPGGHITIELTEEPGAVEVVVRDTGIGIRPEMLSRIFEMFTQADRVPGRLHEGLGIGLTLVRSLIHMHGGRIEARSGGIGHGSEFVIRLPTLTRPVDQADLPDRDAEKAMPSCVRVLVVDDNIDVAESLATLLQVLGHQVQVAHTGLRAIEQAIGAPPDLVLLDIGLPEGMDGYAVARRMRQEDCLRDVMLAAVTGFGQDEDRRLAQEAGFDAHLVKPVEPEALNELVARVLERKAERKPGVLS